MCRHLGNWEQPENCSPRRAALATVRSTMADSQVGHHLSAELRQASMSGQPGRFRRCSIHSIRCTALAGGLAPDPA